MTRPLLQKLALSLGLAGGFLLFLVPTADSEYFPTTCGSYVNSSVQYDGMYGGYCGGYGGVCAECSTGYRSGYTVCVSDSQGQSICTDYQNV